MRVLLSFIWLLLLARPSDERENVAQSISVHKIPKRYSKDWRLFCNVCNHFIWRVQDRLKKSIQEGDEHDFESRFGFRLDSNGKKQSLKTKSVDIMRSEIKITETLDEDICKLMKADAVLYNKTSEMKEGIRILKKDQKYNKTKELGFSKKKKYTGKANTYCAEVYQRFYDEIVWTFTSENTGSRVTFCRDNVDSRCPSALDLEPVIIKNTTKNKSKRSKKRKNKDDVAKKNKTEGPVIDEDGTVFTHGSIPDYELKEEGVVEPRTSEEQLRDTTTIEQERRSEPPEEVDESYKTHDEL